jgi:prepilin peptidase CpaA
VLLLLTLGLLVVGTACDLRRREIPDVVPLALLALGVISRALHVSPLGWLSLVLGFGAGAAIGVVMFWSGGFGGGDAKVLAALGAIVGPLDLWWIFVCIALAGGALALIAHARGKRDLAYGPALLFGFIAFLAVRGLH